MVTAATHSLGFYNIFSNLIPALSVITTGTFIAFAKESRPLLTFYDLYSLQALS
jgi:hypothetical protein